MTPPTPEQEERMKLEHIHGVYVLDEAGNSSLHSLFTDIADANQEATRLSEEGAHICSVGVFVGQASDSWRQIFRNGAAKE
jgi:hypothetical protein